MCLRFLNVFSYLIDHFFLTLSILSSNLSWRCTTVCLSTYLLKDILVVSTFWWIWIKLLETFTCIAWLCGKTAKLSSKVAILFCICTSNVAQHFFQSWVLSVLWFLVILITCVSWYFHSYFNLQSPSGKWHQASFLSPMQCCINYYSFIANLEME